MSWFLTAALLLAWGTPLLPAAEGAARGPSEGVNLKPLRMAIEDLIATFGPQYPKGREYLARLEALEKGGAGGDPAKLDALKREALLANPLLGFDKLLLVRRAEKGDLGLTPNWGGKTDIAKTGYDNEIVMLSPVGPHGTLTTLYRPAGREFVGDLDLHWDADRLLFSMPSRKGAGPWNVYELALDPSAGGARQPPRQVTADRPDVDSYDACYLPDGRIIFSSTASQNVCPCWGRSASHSAAQLYLLDRGSGRVRQLCFDQDHNWCPTVTNDGRVLYLRWEYTDAPHYFTRLLFTMNPDGTGQMAYYGSNSYWPNAVFDARPIPGHPSLVAGVVGGHHGTARAGELVLLDAARGQAESEGAVQRIPGYGKKVEPVIRDALVDGSWPKFLHPFPLGDPATGAGAGKYFLVSCKMGPTAAWVLCLADVFDNIVPIRGLPGSALLEPFPLVRRPLPPAVPDRVQLDRKDATVLLSDVYAGPGLAGVPRGTVRRLRVFAYHYAYRGTGGHGAVGTDGSWDVKRVLGTVPVYEDGSAHFVVPANTPISVQPLDAQGKALQLMRSWFTAMPGEHVSCVGCHERRAETLAVRGVAALGVAPSPITPWRGPVRGFSFAREVQPVLDKHCVGCHNGRPRPDGRAIPDLCGGRIAGPDCRDPALGIVHPANCQCGIWHKWPINRSVSYEILQRYVRRPGGESDYHLLPPLEFHADTSELIQMLTKGHHGVKLDAEAWDRLVTWIDLNVPYHGNWGEYHVGQPGAAQRRREYARLFAGLEEDPEWLPPLPTVVGRNVIPSRTDRPSVLPKPEIKVPGWPFTSDEARKRQQDAADSLSAAGAKQPEMKLDLGNGLAMHLVLIPAGEFLMGDAAGSDDEQPLSRVRIQRPFWMGKFEVTNRQYALFDPQHDSRYISVFGKDITYRGLPVNRPKQPVVRVPWTKAMQFCRWLSARTGRRFSLPTEAQWEWACRCGGAGAMSYGGADADFGKLANLADRRLVLAGEAAFDWMPKVATVDDGARVTADVGRYAPNGWGVHDVHGNAAEWTRSLYRPYPYQENDGRNDPAAAGGRVVRGGSFHDRPHRARSAFRLSYPAWSGVYSVGFRVVCEAAEDWPQFRGPGGDGVSAAAGLPLRWSDTQNVRWKVAIPGRGHSSPVVLGERIWLTTAVDTATRQMGHGTDKMQVAEQVVLGAVCLDRASGRLLYHKELFRLEKPGPVHALNSYATPTPVVERGRLYCDFGTFGTVCLDAATGETLWQQRLPLEHQVGPGSSPVLYQDLLLVVRDGCDAQYVAALDKKTGQTVWKTDRPEIDANRGDFKKSFSTPLVIDVKGRPQAIVPGAHWVVSYDPATGKPIWQVRHGTGYSLAPRPVSGHGLVYICTGGYVAQLWAIRAGGHGDVSDSHVAWKATSQIPLMSSPLLVGQELYIVSDTGIASCFDALTGKMHWRGRLGGNYAASPVYADGRIYFFSREGKTTVLKPGKEFTRLAENRMDGAVVATPAPAGKSIFLRTDSHLYRIEE